MEKTRGFTNSLAFLRVIGGRLTIVLGAIICAASTPPQVHAVSPSHARHTRGFFRADMATTIRADHPAIVPVAQAIRAVTSDPLEQLVMVNDVTHLLVDYDDDERVYGTTEFHATFEEMLARRRQSGWLYLRDDCDGRAVFAAHLLSALGITWRLEASYWKEHAWITAKVGGREYDLLDLRKNAPETNRISYKLFGRHFVRPSNPPPTFAWRRAWAQRTHRDLNVGLALGLLAVDSTPTSMKERYATDWTRRAPNTQLSPVDDRALSVTVAGFPYGEPLHIAAVAGVSRAEKAAAAAVATAGSTSSPNSSAR